MDWTKLFEDIFGQQGQVTTAQECARAALIFAYGLLLVRLAGRRVFGKWSALDIIISIMIGSNLSRALTGSAPLLGTMLASALLLALHAVLAHAAARSPLLARLFEGKPVRLARAGEIDPATLKRHAITATDLHESLRKSGVESLRDTRLVTLEPSGNITVIKG